MSQIAADPRTEGQQNQESNVSPLSTFGNSTLIAHKPSSTSFTCQRNVPLAVLMLAEQKSDAVFADVCVACKLGAMSQVVI
jgi:hypothetical protein